MVKVQAWERLNDPDYCGRLTMGEFESLMLRAGYDPDVAHQAAMIRGWERLDRGVNM